MAVGAGPSSCFWGRPSFADVGSIVNFYVNAATNKKLKALPDK